MAIDLMALEPQKISKNLKGKFAMIYGDPGYKACPLFK